MEEWEENLKESQRDITSKTLIPVQKLVTAVLERGTRLRDLLDVPRKAMDRIRKDYGWLRFIRYDYWYSVQELLTLRFEILLLYLMKIGFLIFLLSKTELIYILWN